MNLKKKLGMLSALIAVLLTLFLFVGMMGFVPLIGHQILGESLIRFVSECTIIFYLVAAWAFWEI